MVPVGLDVGYGYCKVLRAGDRQPRVFPSVLGRMPTTTPILTLPGASQDGVLLVRFPDGETRVVGDGVHRLRLTATEYAFSRERLSEGAFLRLAEAALGLAAGDGDALVVATGLPSAYYDADRQRLRDLLRGSHEVAFLDLRGRVVREVRYAAQDVVVVPQPVGSLAHLWLGDDGNPRDASLRERFAAVIDVGFRTTDLAGVVPGFQYAPELSAGFDLGMADVWRRVGEALRTERKLTLDPYSLDLLAREQRDGGRLTVPYRGGRLDITGLYQDAARAVAEEMWGRTVAAWDRHLDQFDLVVLSGGGGAALAPYLQPLAERHGVRLHVLRGAQSANVRGFLKLAAYHAARKGRRPA